MLSFKKKKKNEPIPTKFHFPLKISTVIYSLVPRKLSDFSETKSNKWNQVQIEILLHRDFRFKV